MADESIGIVPGEEGMVPKSFNVDVDLDKVNELTIKEAIGHLHITELANTGKVVIPTSLTFWSQPETAMHAPNAVEIPADSKGTIVRARIQGHDGEKVNISYFDCQIEATIAQMVYENGVPLYVTPAQIYRKFSQGSREVTVTKKQESEVIQSVDKLMKTPATLDFTEEIQNHTKLKRNPQFDYSNTVIEGTLITGLHISQSLIKAASLEAAEKKVDNAYYYKGHIVEHVFVIYSMPMYAVHDHMVNQIATFSNKFLQGESKASPTEPLHEKREPINESHVISMKRYILLQIRRMKQNQNNERMAARYRGDIPSTEHTERLSFAKIAEHADITMTPRTTRTLRTNTERILNALIREGLIRSYAIYKKGRAFDGVEITT